MLQYQNLRRFICLPACFRKQQLLHNLIQKEEKCKVACTITFLDEKKYSNAERKE